MTVARKQQVHLDTTPYYHCMSRCVRRAFLCGDDPLSGQNFDHRKQWIVDKIKQLSTVFAVDICAFAVLSNHYHIVLSVNQEEAKGWSDEEVIEKWYSLFNGHPFVDQRQAGETLSRAVQTEIKN